MSAQTIGGALERRDNSPTAMVQQYKGDFAMVLPSHMNPDAFVRVAVGVLRRNPKLAEAAANDPGAFMAAMMDAARLGLEPGTEQYWLIPRYDKRVGKKVVSGQRGYQGEIELIYRAGAVASVMCEAVREADEFVWNPGQLDAQTPPRWHGPMDRPLHVIDWNLEDRGPLKFVYAYALMKAGGVSKVVVLNRAQIAQARAMSQTTGTDSPWIKWEESMWLKTGVHRLQKWVPTSAEYIGVKPGPQLAPVVVPVALPAAPPMPSSDEMWADAEVYEGELVDEHNHLDDHVYRADCPACQAEPAATT